MSSIKLLAVIFSVLLIFSETGKAQSPAFDELRGKFADNQVFTSSFEHTYIDSYTGETSTSTGVIWIDQVGYKLEGDHQLILVDGELSKVYDELRNRLIISEYDPDEDDFAPSRMLSGLDDTYTPAQESLDNGNTLIVLTTEDDFEVFVRVEIEVDSNLEPLKITAYDFAENVIITTFENGEFISRDENLFTLDYPDDAEVVDMRF
ncbi:MAG: outer membrane lipoprotein carrier protein LolA [Balneola sp.]|nr:MAG: outer membrane lipoprotein carrier protein LolA [Balneola sp.]